MIDKEETIMEGEFVDGMLEGNVSMYFIYANPAKLVKLDTYIVHWVAVYLDNVGIVNGT